jgi:hypothetical protein
MRDRRLKKTTQESLATVVDEAPSEKEVKELGTPSLDPDTLAISLNVPVKVVTKVIAAVTKHNAEHLKIQAGDEHGNAEQVLRTQLALLNEAIEIADFEFRSFPTSDNSYSLTALVGTAQTVLKNIRDFCEVDVIVKRIERAVLEPYTKEVLRLVIEHIRQLQEEMNDYADTLDDQEEIKQKFETVLRDELGVKITESYDKTKENIRKVVANK